ncbi:hypothetical protein Tco_1448196 [Tanacetum coccineum]
MPPTEDGANTGTNRTSVSVMKSRYALRVAAVHNALPATHRKKNRLMRIDELHKFSDSTLNDVRTALDDRLNGIRMKYMPQTIWIQSDRDKAGAMIQVVRYRYSNLMIQPEPEGSTQEYPLDSVEVLREGLWGNVLWEMVKVEQGKCIESSGSGLTADSSVLTLTLAFLDFGLDFAQSFPFHAQFKDLISLAGIPVNGDLLKLNLPDQGYLKMEVKAGNQRLLWGRVDVVFDGVFGGVGDEEVVVGECVVVISLSLDMLTNNCLGGIMVSLIFLKGLDEEALVEFMVE